MAQDDIAPPAKENGDKPDSGARDLGEVVSFWQPGDKGLDSLGRPTDRDYTANPETITLPESEFENADKDDEEDEDEKEAKLPPDLPPDSPSAA